MLTKSDLSAIKSIVQDEVKAIVNSEVKSIVKNEVKAVVKSEIRSEVAELKNEISSLKSYLVERMDRNTQELVELITTLHNSHEDVLDNHERRLTHIESISFKSN